MSCGNFCSGSSVRVCFEVKWEVTVIFLKGSFYLLCIPANSFNVSTRLFTKSHAFEQKTTLDVLPKHQSQRSKSCCFPEYFLRWACAKERGSGVDSSFGN